MGKEKRKQKPEGRAVPAAIVFTLVGILFLLALIGFTPGDSLYFSPNPPAHPHHFLGKPGVVVASALLYYYGRAAFFLLFFLFYTAYVLFRRNNREKRAGLVILAFGTVITSAAFFSFLKTAPAYAGGGVFGNFLAARLQKPLGKAASVVLFSALSFGVVLALLKFPIAITRRAASIAAKGLLRCFRRKEKRPGAGRDQVIFKPRDANVPGENSETSGESPFEYRQRSFQNHGWGSGLPRGAGTTERRKRHDLKPPLIQRVYFSENGSPVQGNPAARRAQWAPGEVSAGEEEPAFRRREVSPAGPAEGSVDGKAREAPVERPAHDSKGQYILPALDGKPDSHIPKGARNRCEKHAAGFPDVSVLKKSISDTAPVVIMKRSKVPPWWTPLSPVASVLW